MCWVIDEYLIILMGIIMVDKGSGVWKMGQ